MSKGWTRIGLLLAGLGLFLLLGMAKAPASPADAGGLPPWRFGMTPTEVASFVAYGPYKTFSNGDMETYAGRYNGHRENVQFFFRDGRLVRIGVYLYEGQNIETGAHTWGEAWAALKAQFGKIELPGVAVQPPEAGIEPGTVAALAKMRVQATGKVQMAPIRQGADKFVFASFLSADVQGRKFYYVVVYYDPPRG